MILNNISGEKDNAKRNSIKCHENFLALDHSNTYFIVMIITWHKNSALHNAMNAETGYFNR